MFVYVIPALVDRRPESSSTFFPLQKFPNFFYWFRLSKATHFVFLVLYYYFGSFYYSTSNFFGADSFWKAGPPLFHPWPNLWILHWSFSSYCVHNMRAMREKHERGGLCKLPGKLSGYFPEEIEEVFCYFLLLSDHFFLLLFLLLWNSYFIWIL